MNVIKGWEKCKWVLSCMRSAIAIAMEFIEEIVSKVVDRALREKIERSPVEKAIDGTIDIREREKVVNCVFFA